MVLMRASVCLFRCPLYFTFVVVVLFCFVSLLGGIIGLSVSVGLFFFFFFFFLFFFFFVPYVLSVGT